MAGVRRCGIVIHASGLVKFCERGRPQGSIPLVEIGVVVQSDHGGVHSCTWRRSLARETRQHAVAATASNAIASNIEVLVMYLLGTLADQDGTIDPATETASQLTRRTHLIFQVLPLN
jgi:hypothetical protein